MRKSTNICMLAILAGWFLLSCDGGKKEFEQANAVNTIESMEQFIANNPDSKYTEQANVILDSLRFSQASEKDSISTYQEFIDTYPESRFIKKAMYMIDSLQYAEADAKNNITSYSEYIRNHPDSKFVPEAKENIEKLVFITVKANDLIQGYKQFMEDYPESAYAEEAKRRISVLKTLPPTYSEVIGTYPPGVRLTSTIAEINGYDSGQFMLGGEIEIYNSRMQVFEYGTKLTVNVMFTMDNVTYNPGDKLTVDRNKDLIKLRSWK